MQLSERHVARCHAERDGTRHDSVGTWADGVAEGATRAGRADHWLESDQACPDLAQRRVARESGVRPSQGDRRSSLIRDDDGDCEGCSWDEAEDRWNPELHQRPPVRLASPDERRLNQSGSERSRSDIRRPRRRTRREDSSRSTPASNHDHRNGEEDFVLPCVSLRRFDELAKRGPKRCRLGRPSAVHHIRYTSLTVALSLRRSGVIPEYCPGERCPLPNVVRLCPGDPPRFW